MEKILEKLLSDAPRLMGSISGFAGECDQFLRDNLGSVPPPLVYAAVVVGVILLVAYMTKVMLRLAIFIIVPTIVATVLVCYVFPSVDVLKALPISAAVFTSIFILKH